MQFLKSNQSSMVFYGIFHEKEKFILSPYPIPLPLPKPNDNHIKIKKVYYYADKTHYHNANIINKKNNYNKVCFLQKDKIDCLNLNKDSIIQKLVIECTFNLVSNVNNIEELKHKLIFISKLSVNYHSRAEKFYLNIANISTYLSIILSAGTISALSDMLPSYINVKFVSGSFAFIIVLINGVVLAYGIQQKANTHSIFRMQWIKLLGDIHKVDVNEDNYDTLKSLEAESFIIHSQEPVTIKKWQLNADHQTRINMGLPQHKT